MVQLVCGWHSKVCLWIRLLRFAVADAQVKLAQQRLQEIEERLPGVLKTAEDLKIRLKVKICPVFYALSQELATP